MQQRLRFSRARGFVVLVGLLSSSICLAQQEEPTAQLEPVVITTTRTEVPLSQTTRSVTVITEADIAAQDAQTVADVLRSVAGLDVVRTGSFGGGTSVFTRGAEADHTAVLIDGVKVNLGGGAFDFADLSVDNIAHIEVLRGPASTLYGTGALGGVIHIITKRGQGRLSGSVGAEGGSFSTHTERAAVQAGTSWGGLSMAGSRTDTEGHLAFNNEYDDTNLALRGDLYPDEQTDVTFTLRYIDSEFHFPTDGAGRVLFHNQFRTSRETTLGLQGARDILPWWRSQLQLGYHRFKSRTRNEFGTPPDDTSISLFVSEEERFTLDWQSDMTLGKAGQVTFGIAYEDETDEENDEDRQTIAGYVQLQITLVENLVLVGGFRIDGHSEFGTEPTYQVSAAYFFPSGTKFHAAVGTGFKAPTFFENFSTSPFALGNPDLDPERSFSWEVGVAQTLWEERLQLAVTYFSNRFQDLIEFTGAPPPGEPNFFNIQEAKAYGLEFSVTVTPLPAWRFGVTYTYLFTEVTDAGFSTDPSAVFVEGEPLLRRPEHKVDFFARYTHERFHSQLDLHYVGTRNDRDFSTFPAIPVDNPAYTKIDLILGYDVVKDWGPIRTLELFGRVENLLDEDYEEAFGFSAPGIAGFGGVKMVF
jgi:vitamin B12 transporter